MNKVGKHYVWLSKRLDATVRMIYEKGGALFIKFEGALHQVRKEGDYYVAEL